MTNKKEIELNENHRKWWESLEPKWKKIFESSVVGTLEDSSIEEWKLKRILNSTVVDCSNKGIRNLDPLVELKNLERLICSENKISSLEPIKGLKNLIWLNCEKTEVSNQEIQDFKAKNPTCSVKSKSPLIEFKPNTLLGIVAVVFLLSWHFFDLGNTFLVIPVALVAIIIGLLAK